MNKVTCVDADVSLLCDTRKMYVDNGQRRHAGARAVTDCINALEGEKRRENAKEHTLALAHSDRWR